jgi:hypothetical protein
MSLELAVIIWEELKQYVHVTEINNASDSMVAVLIDNDYSAEDILTAFRHDADIKQSLNSYIGDEVDDDTEEDYFSDELDDYE